MKCKLREIVKKAIVGGTPASLHSEYYDGGNIPWVNTKEINYNRIYCTEKNITDLGLKNSAAKIVNPNSVIMAMYCRGTAGRVAINKVPVTTNQACCSLEIDNKKADYRYVYYALMNKYAELDLLANGAAQQNLNKNIILDFEIDLPDLAIQKKIAHILSAIDDRIESNTQTNRFLTEESQLLFDDYVENNDLEYRKISSFNPILETGKRPSGGIGNIRDGIPSVGAESIKGIGYFDYTKTKYVSVDFFKKMKKGIVHGYELLIYKDGGKPGYFIPNFSMFGEGFPYKECAINEHVFLLDFKETRLNIFAYYFFNSAKTRHRLHVLGSKTAAIPGINQQDILNLEMPLLDRMSKNTLDLLVLNTKKVLSNSKQNHTLSAIRDTLLPRLVDGSIDIDGVTV